MPLAVHNNALSAGPLRLGSPAVEALVSAGLRATDSISRRHALRRLDRQLSRRNHKSALSLVKQLQGKPGGLRAFGAAKQILQRTTSMDESKFGKMDLSFLQPLVDSIFDSIRKSIQFGFLDEVSLEEMESLTPRESKESFYEKYYQRCMQHEAGHFLVAYLLGVLPRAYKIPSMEDLMQDNFTGGRVEFVDFEFLNDVNKDKKSLTALNRVCCIILGGLVAEHLVFGFSKGFHSDVRELDRMLKLSGLAEGEMDSRVKWAVQNAILILHCNHAARTRLADAMASGRFYFEKHLVCWLEKP
ncbi:uncharacterized protein LOC131153339 isoform X2 [Malania oleifera]|uniref:uncharacterized protein LOC131153339 isoform X2 n=1 Tax=Malania oleifera TaxID=397392 RepID=UPI0025AE59CC|nr:uncharacterized protein LOC131153339 isoform X2 [Malania oleifera]